MINKINFDIEELKNLKRYPEELFYIGNISLLKKIKVSIVGTRKPNQYAKSKTFAISRLLSKKGICVVSGAALGVDSIAHSGCESSNTIAVMANGLDIKYPSTNRVLIGNIEKNGLVISQYRRGTKARRYSFLHRNEIVVALGKVTVITQADMNSGSMYSATIANRLDKKIYTLPHRLDESRGTNYLLSKSLATPIYDIDCFVETILKDNNKQIGQKKTIRDDFLEFCKTNPSVSECIDKFGNRLYEYELEGKIEIKNFRVFIS